MTCLITSKTGILQGLIPKATEGKSEAVKNETALYNPLFFGLMVLPDKKHRRRIFDHNVLEHISVANFTQYYYEERKRELDRMISSSRSILTADYAPETSVSFFYKCILHGKLLCREMDVKKKNKKNDSEEKSKATNYRVGLLENEIDSLKAIVGTESTPVNGTSVPDGKDKKEQASPLKSQVNSTSYSSEESYKIEGVKSPISLSDLILIYDIVKHDRKMIFYSEVTKKIKRIFDAVFENDFNDDKIIYRIGDKNKAFLALLVIFGLSTKESVKALLKEVKTVEIKDFCKSLCSVRFSCATQSKRSASNLGHRMHISGNSISGEHAKAYLFKTIEKINCNKGSEVGTEVARLLLKNEKWVYRSASKSAQDVFNDIKGTSESTLKDVAHVGADLGKGMVGNAANDFFLKFLQIMPTVTFSTSAAAGVAATGIAVGSFSAAGALSVIPIVGWALSGVLLLIGIGSLVYLGYYRYKYQSGRPY